MGRSMNRNVRNTLWYYPCLTICTSLATSAPLAAYILLLTDSKTKVGLAVGLQGVANLCSAFPAAWAADRWSRPAVIRIAVAVGLCGFAALGYVVAGVPAAAGGDRLYGFLCLALATIGLFMGGHSSAVEALFGDSVESGTRSRLYARKSALKVLGNAAGPLVSIAVFASLGNTWRRSELEVVILIGCGAFAGPALFALALSETATLGGSLSESLLTTTSPERRPHRFKTAARRRELRIAATVCCADVVSMLGSGTRAGVESSSIRDSNSREGR